VAPDLVQEFPFELKILVNALVKGDPERRIFSAFRIRSMDSEEARGFSS